MKSKSAKSRHAADYMTNYRKDRDLAQINITVTKQLRNLYDKVLDKLNLSGAEFVEKTLGQYKDKN